MAGTLALSVPALFFLVFNFVGGIAYTYLKFDVLGHSDGTGVIPGPWLVVPIMALAVFPAALVLGLVAWVVWRLIGRRGGLVRMLLLAFVVCSVILHAYVVRTIILDPQYYAIGPLPPTEALH